MVIPRPEVECDRNEREHRRSGFSLVELIVSVVILSVGVLSMAGTSAWVVRQITLSRLNTERTLARQSAIETIKAGTFESAVGGSGKFGIFDVSWTVTRDAGSYKTFRFVTVGMGQPRGTGATTALSADVADTVSVTFTSPGW